MFLPKVGSDACLVLDCIYNSDTKTATSISDVSLNDLQEAAKTRCVVFRVVGFDTSPELAVFGYLLGLHMFTNGVSIMSTIDAVTVVVLAGVINNSNKLVIAMSTE